MTTVKTETVYQVPFDASAPKRVDRVVIRHFYDETGDASYLDDPARYADEPPERRAAYVAEDRARLDALYRGDWCFIGVRADAEVSYPLGNGCRRLERVKSGGLWGIESDSGADYLGEVERNELDDLRAHLRALCGIEFDVAALMPAVSGR